MVKDIIKTVTFSCMLAGSMFVTCHVCAVGSVVNICSGTLNLAT